MTADLFSAVEGLERIRMQDAEVYYLRTLALAEPPQILMQRLIGDVPWRAEEIVVWGKKYAQPRLIAWYGDGKEYTYSGIHLAALPWTPLLLDIKGRLEAFVDNSFNSVLLN